MIQIKILAVRRIKYLCALGSYSLLCTVILYFGSHCHFLQFKYTFYVGIHYI